MPGLAPIGGRRRRKKRHPKHKKKTDKKKNKKRKKARAPGLLTTLSDACSATSRAIAATGLFAVVYDNINMMVRVAEQILGRKSEL
jgi:hypothetical protein